MVDGRKTETRNGLASIGTPMSVAHSRGPTHQAWRHEVEIHPITNLNDSLQRAKQAFQAMAGLS